MTVSKNENAVQEAIVDEKTDLSFLLDPAYPLLATLQDKCIGTHKHSQAVASMAERVSMVLNLDTTILKIAAQYHDIGKINNPSYFSENQLDDENPHDSLDPWVSSQIISKHISDSVCILLNDPNFPREIIDIISRHHGSEVMRGCFNRTDKKNPEQYRHKFSPPNSVESAVLMICDHIEAKAKSYSQHEKDKKIKFDPLDIIESTINDLINDGQLDNVKMSFGDLKRLKEALAKELEGTYQRRVDYNKKAQEEKEKNKK